MIKTFEEYQKEGIATKVKINRQRAKSLILESERRVHSLNERQEKIGISNENANDYVEYCYDIMMFLIRAKMLLDGYKASGLGAHEAEIAYMRNFKLDEKDIKFADQVRYFRNGILYYGTALDKEYAERVLEFLNKIYPRLKRLVENK